MASALIPQKLGLKAGDWVEVRSREEIFTTLDKNGRLDELPFMPQMLQYCGKRLQVRKRAHKLCDTAFATGALKMVNAVFLEDVRCDGQTYGGCELRCLIFWKEAWLKRADSVERISSPNGHAVRAGTNGRRNLGCSEADILAATRAQPKNTAPPPETIYVCQATQMVHATTHLSPFAPGQYIEDYTSGNAPLSRILAGLFFVVYSTLVDAGLGFGSAMRWAYDMFQKLRGGSPYPSRRGHLPKNARTPTVKHDLQVGELVRTRGYNDILDTVTEELVNRGMTFHPEMVPHCGKTFRVRQRVGKIMNERTGQLVELKNECLVLDAADCIGRFTRPLNCPKAAFPYWREIWLQRVETPPPAAVNEPCAQSEIRSS